MTLLDKQKNIKYQVKYRIWDKIRLPILNEIWDQIRDQIYVLGWYRIRDQVWGQINTEDDFIK